MTHQAPITRANPGCILFLIDQSTSMGERLDTGSKADEVASILNRTLQELVIRCSREEGIRDYFQVGVLGYGLKGPVNLLPGSSDTASLVPISELGQNPLKVEERTRKVPDGAGGLVEESVRFPIWIEPVAHGNTPMCAALRTAAELLVPWCDNNPESFPPIVIHLTDGEATDGDPELIAEDMKKIATDDGPLLLLNIHVSGVKSDPIRLPESMPDGSDEFAAMLFRMSSTLAGHMLDQARVLGYPVTEQSRGFMFNAKYEDIVHFINIGTPQEQAMR